MIDLAFSLFVNRARESEEEGEGTILGVSGVPKRIPLCLVLLLVREFCIHRLFVLARGLYLGERLCLEIAVYKVNIPGKVG